MYYQSVNILMSTFDTSLFYVVLISFIFHLIIILRGGGSLTVLIYEVLLFCPLQIPEKQLVIDNFENKDLWVGVGVRRMGENG